ncbi:transposon Ty3-I Gag-Pol polyprotein [Trichonephila inaurata madagascariensis]|uniref:Transposon Ty3-I Gag-Pol polyprotein n=1 Tax=Trichonephila inaurata madagascariensis TaxID=2747483 RepID=A0A8X6X172_9ARAC|nr:transposon Ty3-I Gag-Pol polyprotein [Trichonephila inaurata madagascariensis]
MSFRSRSPGAQPLTWTSELDTAFSKCKEALSEVTLLMHPAPDEPLGLFTDASAHHIGVALMQRVDDHKPITYAFLQRCEKLPPVQLNQLSFIGQFTTDIQHISGADSMVADALSHISYIAPPPMDLKAIAEAQKGDTELLDLQTSDNSLKLEKIKVSGSDVTLLCQDPDLLFPLLNHEFKVTVAPGLVLVYITNVRRSPDTTPLLFRPSLQHRYDFDTSILTSLDHYPLQNRIVIARQPLTISLIGWKHSLWNRSLPKTTHISGLCPVPASCHGHGTPFVFKDLETCTYAMLRDDSIRGTLQPPYSGPYRILQCIGKVFVLRIGTKEVRVSVDNIKPAYVLADDPPSSGPSLPTPGSSTERETHCNYSFGTARTFH